MGVSDFVKIFKTIVYLLLSAVVVIAVFTMTFRNTLTTFVNIGTSRQLGLSLATEQSWDFVNLLSVYGEHYFEAHDSSKESDLYPMIQYDAQLNQYWLDERESIGTLTGLGAVPSSGIQKTEINFALSLNAYFCQLYSRQPDIAWMYYTSQNDFLMIYPAVHKSFVYRKDLKQAAYYRIVTPEYDAMRIARWTEVYEDLAGKGQMVTLSSPVYHQDTFMGVVSLDLTTDYLQKLLSSGFDSCLVDDTGSMVAIDQHAGSPIAIQAVNGTLMASAEDIQNIRQIQDGTVERIGTNYYFKYHLTAAPWTFIMKLSVLSVAAKAGMLALPVCIVSVLLLINLREAENRKRAEKELRVIATTDKLTGLKNRYYLDAEIEKEFQRASRSGQHLAVITFDLDHFKRVNDTFGHDIGDEVLIQTAQTAQSLIRATDAIVRMGGEEFLILLPKTDSREAFYMAEKIREALETKVHPVAGICTASFGVAEMVPGESYSDLYRRADEALYLAKESGRNRVYSYESIEGLPTNSVIVEWNPNWNSGNQIIDAQHREILQMSNEIMAMSLHALQSVDAEQKLGLLLQSIHRHTETEEKLMEEIGYPNLEEHQRCHRVLYEEAIQLKEDYENGKVNPAVFFSFVINKILVGHMMESDRRYFPYIVEWHEKNKKRVIL